MSVFLADAVMKNKELTLAAQKQPQCYYSLVVPLASLKGGTICWVVELGCEDAGFTVLSPNLVLL